MVDNLQQRTEQFFFCKVIVEKALVSFLEIVKGDLKDFSNVKFEDFPRKFKEYRIILMNLSKILQNNIKTSLQLLLSDFFSVLKNGTKINLDFCSDQYFLKNYSLIFYADLVRILFIDDEEIVRRFICIAFTVNSDDYYLHDKNFNLFILPQLSVLISIISIKYLHLINEYFENNIVMKPFFYFRLLRLVRLDINEEESKKLINIFTDFFKIEVRRKCLQSGELSAMASILMSYNGDLNGLNYLKAQSLKYIEDESCRSAALELFCSIFVLENKFSEHGSMRDKNMDFINQYLIPLMNIDTEENLYTFIKLFHRLLCSEVLEDFDILYTYWHPNQKITLNFKKDINIDFEAYSHTFQQYIFSNNKLKYLTHIQEILLLLCYANFDNFLLLSRELNRHKNRSIFHKSAPFIITTFINHCPDADFDKLLDIISSKKEDNSFYSTSYYSAWIEISPLILVRNNNKEILKELCMSLITIASKSEQLNYLAKSIVEEYEGFDVYFCNYVIDLITIDMNQKKLITCLEMVLIFSEKAEVSSELNDMNLIKKIENIGFLYFTSENIEIRNISLKILKTINIVRKNNGIYSIMIDNLMETESSIDIKVDNFILEYKRDSVNEDDVDIDVDYALWLFYISEYAKQCKEMIDINYIINEYYRPYTQLEPEKKQYSDHLIKGIVTLIFTLTSDFNFEEEFDNFSDFSLLVHVSGSNNIIKAIKVYETKDYNLILHIDHILYLSKCYMSVSDGDDFLSTIIEKCDITSNINCVELIYITYYLNLLNFYMERFTNPSFLSGKYTETYRILIEFSIENNHTTLLQDISKSLLIYLRKYIHDLNISIKTISFLIDAYEEYDSIIVCLMNILSSKFFEDEGFFMLFLKKCLSSDHRISQIYFSLFKEKYNHDQYLDRHHHFYLLAGLFAHSIHNRDAEEFLNDKVDQIDTTKVDNRNFFKVFKFYGFQIVNDCLCILLGHEKVDINILMFIITSFLPHIKLPNIMWYKRTEDIQHSVRFETVDILNKIISLTNNYKDNTVIYQVWANIFKKDDQELFNYSIEKIEKNTNLLLYLLPKNTTLVLDYIVEKTRFAYNSYCMFQGIELNLREHSDVLVKALQELPHCINERFTYIVNYYLLFYDDVICNILESILDVNIPNTLTVDSIEKIVKAFEKKMQYSTYVYTWIYESKMWLLTSKDIRITTTSLIIFNSLYSNNSYRCTDFSVIVEGITRTVFYFANDINVDKDSLTYLIDQTFRFFTIFFQNNDIISYNYVISFYDFTIKTNAQFNNILPLFELFISSKHISMEDSLKLLPLVRPLYREIETDNDLYSVIKSLYTRFQIEEFHFIIVVLHKLDVYELGELIKKLSFTQLNNILYAYSSMIDDSSSILKKNIIKVSTLILRHTFDVIKLSQNGRRNANTDNNFIANNIQSESYAKIFNFALNNFAKFQEAIEFLSLSSIDPYINQVIVKISIFDQVAVKKELTNSLKRIIGTNPEQCSSTSCELAKSVLFFRYTTSAIRIEPYYTNYRIISSIMECKKRFGIQRLYSDGSNTQLNAYKKISPCESLIFDETPLEPPKLAIQGESLKDLVDRFQHKKTSC